MANSEDLEKLCQGPKVWNDWRSENPDRIPDLRDARLTLCQRQFGPSHGGPVDLIGGDLEGAELRHATLTGAKLQRSNLIAADLVHAKLDQADLRNADMTDAVLDFADLSDANLDGAILVGTSLAGVRGLTHDQIANAHGDASTVLPGTMMAPESWFPPLEEDMFAGSPAPEEPIHESDPYRVLGVEPSANRQDIRTAFRSLVKMYHPDLNPDDAEAQEMFKRISIAYRILGDPAKRARYDRGEIGGDGELSPEFEARQQFRRHAFRFYAAAAASLVVAVGALFAVWYAVLVQDEPQGSRLRIAVDAPVKSDERLPGVNTPPAIEARLPQDEIEVPNPETAGVMAAPEQPEQVAESPQEDEAQLADREISEETAVVAEAEATSEPSPPSPASDEPVEGNIIAASAAPPPEPADAIETSGEGIEEASGEAETEVAAFSSDETSEMDDETPVPDPLATAVTSDSAKVESSEPVASDTSPEVTGEETEQAPPHDQVAALSSVKEQDIEPEPLPPHDLVDIAPSEPTQDEKPADTSALEPDAAANETTIPALAPSPHEEMLLRSANGQSLGGGITSAIFRRTAVSHALESLQGDAEREAAQLEVMLFSPELAPGGPRLGLEASPPKSENAAGMLSRPQAESAANQADGAMVSDLAPNTRLAQDHPDAKPPSIGATMSGQHRPKAVSEIVAGGL